jgi:hypothetical protein
LERCLPEVPGESNNPGSTRKHFPGSGEKFGGFNKRRRNSDVKKYTRALGVIWSEPASYLDEKDGSIMLTSTIKRNAFRVLATLAFAAAPAFASMIFVNNFSFETLPGTFPTDGCTGICVENIDGVIPGWNSTIQPPVQRGGQLQPKVATGGYINQDDGLTSAWANEGMFYQLTGATVGIGTVYTLRVDIGMKTSESLGHFGGSADLLIGSATPHTVVATGAAPTPGGWSTFTATYTGIAADAGARITIQLQNIHPDVYQANFDNVRLDDAVPEPASFLLIGSALLALKAFRRRRPIA